MQFMSDRQGILIKERVGEGRNWLAGQVEIARWTRPPQRLWQGLDLLPGRYGDSPMLLVRLPVDSGSLHDAPVRCAAVRGHAP